jgi:hypothetical protein
MFVLALHNDLISLCFQVTRFMARRLCMVSRFLMLPMTSRWAWVDNVLTLCVLCMLEAIVPLVPAAAAV